MDGTEERKDTSQTGDSSSERQRTSVKEPETSTEELMRKAVSDALSAAGRTAQAFEKREQAIKDTEDRLAQSQRDKDQTELEAARDDPDALNAIRTRHRSRETDAENAKLKQELEEERAKRKQRDDKEAESTMEGNTREIAARLNVDSKLLAKLAKTTDGSKEAIEAEAQELPRLDGKPPLKLDSGRTIGGVGWRDLSSDEKIRLGTK